MKIRLVNSPDDLDNPIVHEGEIDDSVIEQCSILRRGGRAYVFGGHGVGPCVIFHEAVVEYQVTEF